MKAKITVDPTLCPLCGTYNLCGNLGLMESKVSDTAKPSSCWCMNLKIIFPAELLAQVPNEIKNTACICASCAKAFGA